MMDTDFFGRLEENMLTVHALTTKDPLENNSYVVAEGGSALLIDPAANAKEILSYLANNKLNLLAILITHAHPDHTNQTKTVLAKHPVPVYIHANEQKMLHYPEFEHRFESVAGLSFTYFDKPFKIGPFSVTTILSPGHTPGSTIYQIGNYWFTGDVLFEKQIGRDDFPGGSPAAMNNTAKSILQVKGDFIVMPGHHKYGTSLSEVKKINPELQEAAAAAE